MGVEPTHSQIKKFIGSFLTVDYLKGQNSPAKPLPGEKRNTLAVKNEMIADLIKNTEIKKEVSKILKEVKTYNALNPNNKLSMTSITKLREKIKSLDNISESEVKDLTDNVKLSIKTDFPQYYKANLFNENVEKEEVEEVEPKQLDFEEEVQLPDAGADAIITGAVEENDDIGDIVDASIRQKKIGDIIDDISIVPEPEFAQLPEVIAPTEEKDEEEEVRRKSKPRKKKKKHAEGGIVDKGINAIGDFIGEAHFPGKNYLGAGTKIRDRLKDLKNNIPVDSLDNIAFKHDIYYMSNSATIRYLADQIFLQEIEALGLDPTAQLAKNVINTAKGARSEPTEQEIKDATAEFAELNALWKKGDAEIKALGYSFPESENSRNFVDPGVANGKISDFESNVGALIDSFDGVISADPLAKLPGKEKVVFPISEPDPSHVETSIDAKPMYSEASTKEIAENSAPPITEAESAYYDRLGISRPELSMPNIEFVQDPSNQVFDSNQTNDNMSIYESTNQYGEVDPWLKAERENKRMLHTLNKLYAMGDNKINVYKFLPAIIQR